MTLELDEKNLEKFWKVIRPGNHKRDYLEIRVTDGNKPGEYYDKFWSFILAYQKHFKRPLLESKRTSIFIKDFPELLYFLHFDDGYFRKNYKLCYGINLRRAKPKNIIAGKYEFINEIRAVFFDIDALKPLSKEEKKEQIDYAKNIVLYLEDCGLVNPIIIHSGGGIHLLYMIKPQKFSEGRKRWFRDFARKLSDKLSNDKFKLDPIYDFTRVFGLPESINLKRQKKVQVLHIPENLENPFRIRIKHFQKTTKKKPGVIQAMNLPEIKSTLEWKIITHPDVPTGEIHNKVLFALKLLLKEKNIQEWKQLELEVNSIRGSSHSLDPFYGTDDKYYSPFIIKNWCRKNAGWCAKHNISWESYDKQVTDEVITFKGNLDDNWEPVIQ